MKVTSLLSLIAAATLVSAGKFIPSEFRPDTEVVPNAYIIEVCWPLLANSLCMLTNPAD